MGSSNRSTLVAASLGLVFGVLGVVAGLVLASRTREPVSTPVSTPEDPALRVAVEELTREVRALHESLGNRLSEPTRQPAPVDGSPPIDVDRLVAAIEKLAPTLNSSVSRERTRSLTGTQRPPNVARLLELQRDEEEVRSRKHRFLTYQEVLDQFGAPSDVYENGRWEYDLSDSGALEFVFYDGLLIRIY